MILSLSLQIFIFNKKRTFQAVSLLAISVGLFVSSSLIVSGFSSELGNFTDLLPVSNEYIIIKHGSSLTTSMIQEKEETQLIQDLTSIAAIEAVLPFKLELANFTVRSYQIITYLMQVNFTQLNEYYKSQIILNKVIQGIIVSEIFAQRYDLSFNQSILVNNKSCSIQQITTLPSLMSEWLLTNSSSFYQTPPGVIILIRFQEDTPSKSIQKVIDSFPEYDFISLDQARNYLTSTSQEFIRTLFYFTIGFMALTMLAIGYTIMTLVRESESDIVLMRILGFLPEQVMLLFMFQAIYIGILGSFFAFATGILLTMGLISLTTLIIQTPYFVVSINSMFFFKILSLSLLVSLISSIPATLYTEIIFKRSMK